MIRMHRRAFLLVVILAMVSSACGVFTTDTTAAPPVTEAAAPTSTGATSEAAEAPVPATDAPRVDKANVRACDGATAEFVVFCDAYETLTDRYVDELADEDLAAGAVRGLREYGGLVGPSDDEDTTCHIPSEAFVEFCSTLAMLENNEGLIDDTLIESAVRGMLDFGLDDPNSNYFDPELFQDFNDSNSGQVQGIGSLVNTVNLDSEDEPCVVISATCAMVIVSPLPGSPSEAVGLQADDVLVAVDGDPITDMTLDEVVSIVRGPAGSQVLLSLERDGEPFDVTITREAISIAIVESEMLTDDVGYVRLVQFTFGSAELFREELSGLIEQGADTIIFDLQSNPGGSLDDSVAIASEFLTEGLVVRTESPNRDIDYEVRPGGLAGDPDIEVYVLMNGGSASASEVVAGALSDQGRATLVGQTTFGKNTVQQNFPLSNGGALKVTIARWVTPNGTDFGEVGIEPDIVIEYPDDVTFDFLKDEVLSRIQNGTL